jgi:hypothetical protein
MQDKTKPYLHLADHQVWDPEELPYGGLCTHSPLVEKLDGIGLSSEDLDAIADKRRLRKNEKLRAWSKADNIKKRANPTPEFVAQRTTINKSKYPSKKNKRDIAVANKTHFCELCEKSYTSAKELSEHQKKPLHLRRQARGEKNFSCVPCGKEYPNKTRYERHCTSKTHHQKTH